MGTRNRSPGWATLSNRPSFNTTMRSYCFTTTMPDAILASLRPVVSVISFVEADHGQHHAIDVDDYNLLSPFNHATIFAYGCPVFIAQAYKPPRLQAAVCRPHLPYQRLSGRLRRVASRLNDDSAHVQHGEGKQGRRFRPAASSSRRCREEWEKRPQIVRKEATRR